MLDQILHAAPIPANGWVLTTLVSSPLIATLARARGLEVVDDLLVGFKHHAGMMREQPERPVVFACEESHGYLRGNDVRDKDAAMAALLLVEAAATCRRAGKSLWQRLDEIWAEHGYHREQTANLWARGQAGREAISAVMRAWRSAPPEQLGGLVVREHIDRLAKDRARTGSATRDLLGDVLVLELAAGTRSCRLVLRPSGTEPKLKLYALAHARGVGLGQGLEPSKRDVDGLAERVLADARARADAIMEPVLGGA
jgi:phosphoglucomutase/phosphomannomutase